jgi:hypothetical protein
MSEPDMEFVDPEPDETELDELPAVEQVRPIDPIALPTTVHRGVEIDEFDEADALDQAREVELDEDEER